MADAMALTQTQLRRTIKVFSMNMVIVVGPTPPGTGVIQLAFSEIYIADDPAVGQTIGPYIDHDGPDLDNLWHDYHVFPRHLNALDEREIFMWRRYSIIEVVPRSAGELTKV